jgi:hypothetical protein
LQALERRVLASVGVAAGAAVAIAKSANSGALGSAAGWLSAGTTKLVVALIAAIAVGGGAVVAWHATGKRLQGHPDVAMPTRVAAAFLSEPTLRPDPPAQTQAPKLVLEEPSPGMAATLAAPVAKKREKPRAAAIEAGRGDTDEEVSLLERANRALAKSPALAVTLADEHARRFPASGMDQEREVIAITALVNLGRTLDAQKRAMRFSRAHPSSVYQGRIDKALAARPQ